MEQPKPMKLAEARLMLKGRHFKFSYARGSERSDGYREYYSRTDGKPDVFMDHSATITRIGPKQFMISDFLNRNGVK